MSQYPNKRAMIVMDNFNVKNISPSDEKTPQLEGGNDEEVEQPIHGDLLVTRCALSIQPKEDDDEV